MQHNVLAVRCSRTVSVRYDMAPVPDCIKLHTNVRDQLVFSRKDKEMTHPNIPRPPQSLRGVKVSSTTWSDRLTLTCNGRYFLKFYTCIQKEEGVSTVSFTTQTRKTVATVLVIGSLSCAEGRKKGKDA